MHIRIRDGSHLGLLNGADLAFGVHDEDADVLLASETVDGRRAGISTRRPNDGQMLSALSLFALVPPHQKVLKQVPHKLEGHIFESKRRPVEELQQVQILLRVQGDYRRDIRRAEGGIAAVDDVPEVVGGNLFRRNVQREDLIRQLLKGIVAPLGEEVGGQSGDFLGDEESAVAGETFEDDVFERELYSHAISAL